MKPISPSEVVGHKAQAIPDFVIETWNRVIAQKWSNGQSYVDQDYIIEQILLSSPTLIDRATVFREKWLDIEDIYRAEGWVVIYDKPHYSENYNAHFVFKQKVT